MAINPTSSSSSSSVTTSAALGKGSSIDIEAIVSKLDSIEQAPIDKLGVKATKQDAAIQDLGVLKTKLSLFQAALQDFTSPLSYISKSISSNNSAIAAGSIVNSSLSSPGVYSISNIELAKSASKTFEVDFSTSGSLTVAASDSEEEPVEYTIGEGELETLEDLRDAINRDSASTKVRASIVNLTGLAGDEALTLTSTTGGAESDLELVELLQGGSVSPVGSADGRNAEFFLNGVIFSRPTNLIEDVIPGVKLQLYQSSDSATISITSGDPEIPKSLLINLGQAYNELMNSYKEFTKFNSDPEKRGSLNGYMDLRALIDSISLSFMNPLSRAGNSLLDVNGREISFTSLGLELQLDGTLLFNSQMYDYAVDNGAIDQISNGSVSPTRTIVNDAMTFGGRVDSFISSYEEQKFTIENRIKELEERKIEKMARYKAQYAALDALLFRLQSLNASLTPTFEALNNRNNN